MGRVDPDELTRGRLDLSCRWTVSIQFNFRTVGYDTGLILTFRLVSKRSQESDFTIWREMANTLVSFWVFVVILRYFHLSASNVQNNY